jgi:hypothetical protein
MAAMCCFVTCWLVGAAGAAQDAQAADDGPRSKASPATADDPPPRVQKRQPANARPSGNESGNESPTGDKKSANAKKTAGDKPAASNAPAAAEVEEQKFVRTLDGDHRKPVMLQTAIVTYKSQSGPYAGAQVDLIGAIHIADKAYFEKLNELFKGYDALLYEMVADPKAVQLAKRDAKDRSAVSALQSGMKDMLGLSFQLDEIDYQAKNFVHADMNPEEFTESLSQRQEGLLQFMMRSMGSSLALQGSHKSNDIDMLAALFSGNRELALKRVLAEQIEQMDGQLAAITGDDGKSTLITERNRKALEVLKRELDAGKKKLGIFYGAGHFRHMGQQLDKDFQMRPVKTEWLDAWNMK